MKVYKLTDEKDRTKNETQWGGNVTHETDGTGDLCGPGWLHAYSDPLVAVLHNSIHGNFDLGAAHMWECRTGRRIKNDRGLKLRTTKLTTLTRVEMPAVSTVNRIAYGILCAKEVCKDPDWIKWADN